MVTMTGHSHAQGGGERETESNKQSVYIIEYLDE